MEKEELVNTLKALRQGALSPREIYHAIQAFGEMNFQEARPEVEHFLKSDDPELRFVALKVLTRYWRLTEHWKTARDVLLHDPDEDCRFRAASDLGSLMMNTNDKNLLYQFWHVSSIMSRKNVWYAKQLMQRCVALFILTLESNSTLRRMGLISRKR